MKNHIFTRCQDRSHFAREFDNDDLSFLMQPTALDKEIGRKGRCRTIMTPTDSMCMEIESDFRKTKKITIN